MVSAACPSCHVILVEATEESPFPNDLAESVNTAVEAGATEVSNSYGLPEEGCGTFMECTRFAPDYSHPGVFISASSGDHGYDNADTALLRRIAPVSGRPARRCRRSAAPASRKPPMPAAGPSRYGTNRAGRSAPAAAAARSPPSRAGRKTKAARAGWATTSRPSPPSKRPCRYTPPPKAAGRIVGGTSASSPLIAGIVAHESESVRSLGRAGLLRRSHAAVRRHRRQQRDLYPAGERRVLLHRRGRLRRTHRARHAQRRRGGADRHERRTRRRPGDRRNRRDASRGPT